LEQIEQVGSDHAIGDVANLVLHLSGPVGIHHGRTHAAPRVDRIAILGRNNADGWAIRVGEAIVDALAVEVLDLHFFVLRGCWFLPEPC